MTLLLVIASTLGALALMRTIYNRWQLAIVERAIASVEAPPAEDGKKAS